MVACVCVCEKDGYQTWGWVEEDCPLLLMCDLTSFENGEPRGGAGRGGGLEFRVLMNLQKCRDFSKGDIFRQLLWYFWEGSHRLVKVKD